jgi:hypothetical protein
MLLIGNFYSYYLLFETSGWRYILICQIHRMATKFSTFKNCSLTCLEEFKLLLYKNQRESFELLELLQKEMKIYGFSYHKTISNKSWTNGEEFTVSNPRRQESYSASFNKRKYVIFQHPVALCRSDLGVSAPSMCNVVRCSCIRHYFITRFGLNGHLQVYSLLYFRTVLLTVMRVSFP